MDELALAVRSVDRLMRGEPHYVGSALFTDPRDGKPAIVVMVDQRVGQSTRPIGWQDGFPVFAREWEEADTDEG